LYDLNVLNEFCINILIKSGMNLKDAEIISDTLMFAELRNVKSHGIVRLPTYIERMQKGVVNLYADMKFINNNSAAVTTLDADNGMGQPCWSYGHERSNAHCKVVWNRNGCGRKTPIISEWLHIIP